MTVAVEGSLEPTSGDSARVAAEQLAEVRLLLSDSSLFQPTRQSQWKILKTGMLVECGYVYLQPWAKILSPDGRRELDSFQFNGRNRDELDRFLAAVTS